MTTEQINLIKTSFQTVTERTADFAEIFYDHLFRIQPVLRLLFPTNIDEQKRMLSAMLEMTIGSLDNFDALIPMFEALGRRHALYGVLKDHYEIASSALIASLSEVLGDEEFTAETRDAWLTMYYRIVDIMRSSARELENYETRHPGEQDQIHEVTRSADIGRMVTLFASIVFFIVTFAGVGSAATFTVTKTADTNDGICNADCSLREAIVSANAGSSVDVINFNIPGGGVKTITLVNLQLPPITNPVTIDGTSQPGYAGPPLIEINGNNIANYGLLLFADSTVRALVINRFLIDGLVVGSQSEGPDVLVTGTYIGTDASGTLALPNGGDGISIDSVDGTATIGGTGANERNVISGNHSNGILVNGCNFFGTPIANILSNNIGVDWTGNIDLGNGANGILDSCGSGTNIGGTTAAARNVISGNEGAGIRLDSGFAVVRGNYIGTSSSGIFAIGNSDSGIFVTTGGNIIGGTGSAMANVISGNTGNGIELYPLGGSTQVVGNMIGTRPSGAAAIPNTGNGIYILDGKNIAIGGAAGSSGNLISGNGLNGIHIEGAQATNISIKGNRIGVTNDSLSKLANGGAGVLIESKNTIVGEAGVAAAANIISGNSGNGIRITTANALLDKVENNFIGTNTLGTNVGNSGSGIVIDSGAHDNVVGGANSTGANTIFFNSLAGVKISGGATTINNAVRNNAISANGGLGIDLDSTGVTANDAGDGDPGANNLQNFPVIQGAFFNEVIGTLNSEPNKTYTIDIYRNNVCDASNNGEGQFNLGSQTVVTDAGGNAVIDISVPVAQGQIISATATDVSGNTSEFAKCFTATTLPGSAGFGTATYNVGESGTTATISVTRTFGSGGAIAVSYATSNGTAIAGQDYTAASGTLTWGDGDNATKTFTVPVTNDTLDEPNETVNLALSNPTGGASLLTSNAVLTINDDDQTPAISVNDVAKVEGDQGPSNFTFNITLSAASGQSVAVDYITVNGTATAGLDYTSKGDTLVFSPGETLKPVTIAVTGDLLTELDETFFVDLQNPVNVIFGDLHGIGTILDDDNAGKLQFASSGTVSESAGMAPILISRTGGSAGTVSVNYATSNGTATAGTDYTATSGTLILLDGQTSGSFNIPILPDNIDEADETVNLTLSNPNGGATLGSPSTAVLTILDDDGAPSNGLITGTVIYGNSAVPRYVSNVLISGAGSVPVSTLTGFPGGAYSLTGFGAGAYIITPTKAGGVNGSITSFDAAKIAQHVAGISFLTGNQLVVADVSNNGTISSFDAGEIANYVVTSSPSGTAGTWRFGPASRTHAAVNTNLAGEDYTAFLMGEVSGNWTNTGARPVGGRPLATARDGVADSRNGQERIASVSVPHLVTPADNDVIVPVSVGGVADKGIIAYELDLRYDPSVIQLHSDPVDLADTISSGLSVAVGASEAGRLRVAVYGPTPIDAGGILLNLRFTAVGAPGSVSPLTWERIMFNEGESETVVSDGEIRLSAAADLAEISGRLLSPAGQCIPNAYVTLIDTTGHGRRIVSDAFGEYRFGGLQIGQTYTLSVDAEHGTFTPLSVSQTGQLVKVDMIADQ